MKYNFENHNRTIEQTNKTNDSIITSERLSKVEDDYEDCFLGEVGKNKDEKVNSKVLEEAEDEYADCGAKVKKLEEKNPELLDGKDDFEDCGKETEGRYVAEVTYVKSEKISEADTQEKLQEAYDECKNPEDMRELKKNVNENEEIKAVDARLIEKPEPIEKKFDKVEKEVEYEIAKAEEAKAEENLKERQEEAVKVEENLKEQQEAVKVEEKVDNNSKEIGEIDVNSEKLSDVLEEKERINDEMIKKFDEVLSKTRGTEEYREALQEYNALKDRKEALDDEIVLYEQQKEGLPESNDEKIEKTQYELCDDAPKMLKRDEFDLLRSGNDVINQRLEIQADNYRDQGMSENEIRDRLAVDRWNFQKEFLEDAFPGQEISPNVFNGFSEKGAKDRIDDIKHSETLVNQLKEYKNEASEDDESIKDLKNKFAAFLDKKTVTDNVSGDRKEVNENIESAQKMIDDYCDNDLKGILSDEKRAIRLEDVVEFQDDAAFEKGLGGKEKAAGINGYNNSAKSYVKKSGPHPKKTAIHEHNHQLSCNDEKDNLGEVIEYKRGVSIDGKDIQVNEALTELFTKKMMGADYPTNPNVGYRDNMLRIEKMESGFGTDTLKKAYYQNKLELLKSKYESVMGEGTWEPFSKSFDESLSKYSYREILAKREHYRKYGTVLQTPTDIRRQNASLYAEKCAALFAEKSKGVK